MSEKKSGDLNKPFFKTPLQCTLYFASQIFHKKYSTCISPIMHLICITFVFHFSRVLQPSQEKLKTMLMQNLGGSGGQIECIMGDVQVRSIFNFFWDLLSWAKCKAVHSLKAKILVEARPQLFKSWIIWKKEISNTRKLRKNSELR